MSGGGYPGVPPLYKTCYIYDNNLKCLHNDCMASLLCRGVANSVVTATAESPEAETERRSREG